MDSKSAFAKVSGQGLKVSLKVAKKIERFTTFKREDKITHRRVPHTPPLQRINLLFLVCVTWHGKNFVQVYNIIDF